MTDQNPLSDVLSDHGDMPWDAANPASDEADGVGPSPAVSMPVRVLIVDNDPEDRTIVARILGSDARIEIVGESSDGDEAVALVGARRPDVVLMDIRMPRVDGITATRRVRATPRPPEVLVFSAFDDGDAVIRSLQAGAAGFILKADPPQEMIQAVLGVVQGDNVLSQPALRHLVAQVKETSTAEARAQANALLGTLSPRERRIVIAASTGLSNAQIGTLLSVSESTVKTALSRAYLKLDVPNRTAATLIVRQAEATPDLN